MSVNKVILVGNVGKDPDVRYFDNDSVKASFPLATSERGYTTANGTQVPERTEWHNVVSWRGLAQIVEKFVKKGMPLYVEGKIRTRSYEDQQGIKRYITEVYADNIELLGRRGSGDQAGGGAQDESMSPSSPSSPSTPSTPSMNIEPPTDGIQSDDGEVDDLPF